MSSARSKNLPVISPLATPATETSTTTSTGTARPESSTASAILVDLQFIQIQVPVHGKLLLPFTVTPEELRQLQASGALSLSLGSQRVAISLERGADGRLIIAPNAPLQTNGIYRIAWEAPWFAGLTDETDFIFLTERTGTQDGREIDIDGDGDLDILSVTYDSEVAIALNPGDASDWEAGYLDATASSATGIAVQDFNGDGLDDFAVIDLTGAARPLRLYTRRAGVTHTAEFDAAPEHSLQPAAPAGTGMDITAADFDLDGDADLAIADFTTGPRLFLNQGGAQRGRLGDFVETPELLPAGRFDRIAAIAVADADLDGDMDLLLGRSYREPILLQNEVTAGRAEHLRFTDISARALPASGWNVADAAFGDLDRDGDPDLVLGLLGGGGRILMNVADPARRFGAAARFTDETAQRAPDWVDDGAVSGVALADVAGFGALDIVVSMLGGPGDADVNRLWINDGGGRFQRVDVYSPDNHAALGAVSGDFSSPRNGTTDLYVFRDGPNLLLNGASGQFHRAAGEPGIDFAVAGDGIAAPAMPLSSVQGDWDRDGDIDIAFGGDDGDLYLALNDWRMTERMTVRRIELGAGGGVTALAALDADLDGDTDLFALSPAGAVLLENRLSEGGFATLPFRPAWRFTPAGPQTTLTCADFDRDGDVDIAAAGANTITFYRNMRDGFAVAETAHDAGGAVGITAGDWLGNGGLCLAVAGPRRVDVFTNESPSGNYEFIRLAAWTHESAELRKLMAADWNRDGALEWLAVAGNGITALSWRDASLQAAALPVELPAPLRDATLADADRDGDADWLIIDDNGRPGLLLNHDNRRWSEHADGGRILDAAARLRQAAARLPGVTRLSLADMDGNACVDLLLWAGTGELFILHGEN